MPEFTPNTHEELDNLELGIEELDEMVDPGFWDTAAGVAVGTVVGAGVVYGGAVLIAT
jgi:hypothetical protein